MGDVYPTSALRQLSSGVDVKFFAGVYTIFLQLEILLVPHNSISFFPSF